MKKTLAVLCVLLLTVALVGGCGPEKPKPPVKTTAPAGAAVKTMPKADVKAPMPAPMPPAAPKAEKAPAPAPAPPAPAPAPAPPAPPAAK
jgi:hypothetical protein